MEKVTCLCPVCHARVEVTLPMAARVMGLIGGRSKGKGKGRKLSVERARELVRIKYAKRHALDFVEEAMIDEEERVKGVDHGVSDIS